MVQLFCGLPLFLLYGGISPNYSFKSPLIALPLPITLCDFKYINIDTHAPYVFCISYCQFSSISSTYQFIPIACILEASVSLMMISIGATALVEPGFYTTHLHSSLVCSALSYCQVVQVFFHIFHPPFPGSCSSPPFNTFVTALSAVHGLPLNYISFSISNNI